MKISSFCVPWKKPILLLRVQKAVNTNISKRLIKDLPYSWYFPSFAALEKIAKEFFRYHFFNQCDKIRNFVQFVKSVI